MGETIAAVDGITRRCYVRFLEGVLSGGGLVQRGSVRGFGPRIWSGESVRGCQSFVIIWYLDGLCPMELYPCRNLENRLRNIILVGLRPGIMFRLCSDYVQIMFRLCSDYVHGDFITYRTVLSYILEVISNGTRIISLNSVK